MDELMDIAKKYENLDISNEISSFRGLLRVSRIFYSDVTDVYDCLTRLQNIDRYASGYPANEAAILGLLVRIWKILKEICVYYQQNNGDMVAQLHRQIVESSVMARFLMAGDSARNEDYRRCGYKSRLQVLQRAVEDNAFFDRPAGKRLLASIKAKLDKDGFAVDCFSQQRKNRWRVEGKSFYDIFSEVEPEEYYKFVYGLPSESLHGSWTDCLDYHLVENESGLYDVQPFKTPIDVRGIAPLIRLCNEAYRDWLKRIDVIDTPAMGILKWIDGVNYRLCAAFEKIYDPDEVTRNGDTEDSHEKVFVQTLFDDNLWKAAKWNGVGFGTSDRDLPTLALQFGEEKAGRKIFSDWSSRLGARDLYEELRVSIVEKTPPVANEATDYYVFLSSVPQHTAERAEDDGAKLDVTRNMVMSCYHLMTPEPHSKNLKRFKEAYLRAGAYFVALLSSEGEIVHSSKIRKREIRFCNLGNIGPEDPEAFVLEDYPAKGVRRQ